MEPSKPSPNPPSNPKKDRDFSKHLEDYLAKRDGVDKLLKISRYASKIIISSSILPENHILYHRLKAFESSVGLSRKAFRLGKFIQDFNALKKVELNSKLGFLGILAYGGEGVYYFVEQFVWLAKAGLIDAKNLRNLSRISAWAEFVGYIGSIALKTLELKKMVEEENGLDSKTGVDREEVRKLREKMVMKRLSIIQDVADGLMAIADIRDGKGVISNQFVVASAGLASALISTHKNWVSC